MSNRIQLEHLHTMAMGEIAALSAQQLALLQEEAGHALAAAKALKDRLDGAIARRFEEHARVERELAGKDTGTVRFVHDDVLVIVELPKRIDWDQERLIEACNRLAEGGDVVDEYVDIAYRVPERRYTAWPSYIRELFAPARTVKTGKPVFKLSLAETEGAS